MAIGGLVVAACPATSHIDREHFKVHAWKLAESHVRVPADGPSPALACISRMQSDPNAALGLEPSKQALRREFCDCNCHVVSCADRLKQLRSAGRREGKHTALQATQECSLPEFQFEDCKPAGQQIKSGHVKPPQCLH